MQADPDLHYSPVDSTTYKDSLHEHEGPDQATVTHRLILDFSPGDFTTAKGSLHEL